MIECRAKNSYTGEWVFGYFVQLDHRSILYTAKPFKGVANFVVDIDPKTLGQVTALKSKERITSG